MNETISQEELRRLRDFKSRLFDLYWEKFGFFYIHAIPHPNLEIGNRGLVGKEKEEGIVLAFGASAVRDISSQPDYIYAELQFGYKWEKLFIPWDCVFRIYDKPQASITQLRVITTEPVFDNNEPLEETKKPPQKKGPDSKVIEVDFSAKKK